MEKKRIVVPVSLSDAGYPVLSELSRELVAMMREKDAPNFIGLQLDDEQGTPWMLTIQRVEGETPEMQCGRLRTQLAESERRRAELVEAVAWEREFDEALVWLVQTGRYPRDMAGKYYLANERECARSEVDRLIGGE